MEAQIVAMYLMTGPHSDMTGAFHCPVLYISHETGIPFEGASKALRRLCEGGFCLYDEASEWVFVFNMAKFQIADVLKPTDNRVKGLREDVKRMPQGVVRKAFLELYNEAFSLGFDAQDSSPLQAPCKPLRSQEQEQEQEQKESEAIASLVASQADDRIACPHQQIIEAWAEILPELPAVKTWSPTRAKHLQARWREQCKSRGWKTQAEGVDWFLRMFGYIRKSAFLMGASPRGDGHESWSCSLPWVIEAENFAKVLEGNYHREAA
jgi:hypothetical protein